MEQTLLSWFGTADLKAANSDGDAGSGPVVQALKERDYSHAMLLCNFKDVDRKGILKWLEKHTKAEIDFQIVDLPDPTDFDEIYKKANAGFERCLSKYPSSRITVHLSPGTGAMAAVWVILAKSRYDSRLIQSSPEQGVKLALIPFDISADYLQARDKRITDQVIGMKDVNASFETITYRSAAMRRLISKANKVAEQSVPVLIEGESGTGKERLAQAIHNASPRAEKKFIPVNCGAIPKELIESYLFGHKKGSFTGAVADQVGVFESADSGTVFLDEVGELSKSAQVKLLRVLQEQEIIPIGETKPKKINVRLISATNRSLISEIREGNFREDLFYRLAWAPLYLPPLREREGDVSMHIDEQLKSVQSEVLDLDESKHKNLSAKARNVLLSHGWPGNIRELRATLARAIIWSEDKKLSEQDIKEALLVGPSQAKEDLLALPLDENFNLQNLLEKIEKHYILRALEESHNVKKMASEKLGMKNYQNLSGKMSKYDID
ncbi:sigma-54 interaction domain-containing protein [Pseudomonadota bacterium]